MGGAGGAWGGAGGRGGVGGRGGGREERHSYCVHAQNTGIYSVFASLYNILHKDLEQENLSQASMPFATMPKTLVFTTFYAQKHWYLQPFNILHKEVEQENLSQASMPFATMPKTLVFTAFMPQKTGLYCVAL